MEQWQSPVFSLISMRHPKWSSSAATLGAVDEFGPDDIAHAGMLGVADVSYLARTGCKGPKAASWLAEVGVPVPASPNTWLALPAAGLVARLGLSEFIIEAGPTVSSRFSGMTNIPGVYPVLRQDASFALCGSLVNQLLLQVCNIDFRELDRHPARLYLTSMAGVGVTILATRPGPLPIFRVWCDNTFGPYLWKTLVEIASELGGDAIGINALHAISMMNPTPNS